MEPPADLDPGPRARRGWLVLAAALTPSVLAVVASPRFLTQDGPAHLYNAQVLADALGGGRLYGDVFAVRWQPLPNWAGHLGLALLMAAIPPAAADRAMTALTLIGPAAAAFWLRLRVAGTRGQEAAALAAALLGLNVAWLLGFQSFLLGATLFPVVLGLWWAGRDRARWGRAAAIGGLLVLGYFGHLVSLGLTAVGLVVLSLATPGPRPGRRLAWTAAGLLPLVPLALIYRGLMRRGGPVEPVWGHLRHPLSPGSWREQLSWVDPLSLASRVRLPFVATPHPAFGLLAPAVWGAAGLGLLAAAELRRPGERRGWVVLAAVLALGGTLGPDTLGPGHGNYLPQRVVWLGLLALLPALDLDPHRRAVRLGTLALAVAVAVQSAFVWEYARLSGRLADAMRRADARLGPARRVAGLPIRSRVPFRSNPLLHLDNLLGVGTGRVVWSDYEAGHYYFPIRIRPDVPHPPPRAFEEVARLDAPADAPARRRLWADLLERHAGSIDGLVTWGDDPGLDAISARSFDRQPGEGPAVVWLRR